MSERMNCCCGGGRICPSHGDSTPEERPSSLAEPAVSVKRELSMMAWLATEGGRKCPQCGRYAKQTELGYTGGLYEIGGVLTHISSYGHLPGYGCNRSQNTSKT